VRYSFVHRDCFSVEPNLRRDRYLVGVVEAGELLELTAERKLIQTLRVATNALLQACRDVYLEESGRELTRSSASDSKGANGGDDDVDAVTGEEMCDECDSRNIQIAVLSGERELST
jgi:hypothetical protein